MRNVFIPPKEKLFSPDLKEKLPDLSEVEELFPFGRRQRKPSIKKKVSVSDSSIPEGDAREETSKTDTFNRFSREFKLGWHQEYGTESLPNSGFNFSLEKKEKEVVSPGKKGPDRERSINLVKHLYSGYSAFTSLYPSKRYSPRGYSSQERRGVNIHSYHLDSWAEAVAELVISNWAIPFSQVTEGKRIVKISVTVSRDGKITSAKVIRSSNLDWLDQTALKAINLSSPFPELPSDFPLENLSIYLVFQTND